MRHLFPASLLPVLLVFTGCALSGNQPTPSAFEGSAMKGSVFGGQQPVTGSTVSVYAVGTSGYGAGATLLASTTTDSSGDFNFPTGTYSCPSAATPIYITAKGGNAGYTTNNNIMLAAGIGSCAAAASLQLNLNEVSTVATAFALSHFFTPALGANSTDAFGGTAPGSGTYNAGLVMANTYTIPAILSVASGTALPSTSTVTREPAKLYTLANIIAACVNSAGGTAGDNTNCGILFANTTPPGGTAPTDTLQAAVQMALYPYQNVATLFNLPPATSPFVGLSTQPNDFTIGISYTASNLGLGVNGGIYSGANTNIDIDADGRIWFPTNSTSAHGLAFFDPSTSAFNGPYITSLVHPQYLAIDNTPVSSGGPLVYGTDLGSPLVASTSVNSPGATITSHGLTPNSTVGPIGFVDDPTYPNAALYSVTASNGTTNVWILEGSNQGISSAFTYAPTGLAPFNYENAATYYETEAATSGASTSCLLEAPYVYQGATNDDQTILASSSPCVSGGVAQLDEKGNESVIVASSLNQLCSYAFGACFAPAVPLNKPEGIAIDGDHNVWIANAGNASISTLLYTPGRNNASDFMLTSPVPYIHNTGNGNTLTTPYGIAIDRSGNVWASNAGCVSTTGTACAPGSFVLSELIGAGAPTVTPIFVQTSTLSSPARPQQ